MHSRVQFIHPSPPSILYSSEISDWNLMKLSKRYFSSSGRPHDHKTFKYMFQTRIPKSSYQNVVFIRYDVLIEWFFFNYMYCYVYADHNQTTSLKAAKHLVYKTYMGDNSLKLMT